MFIKSTFTGETNRQNPSVILTFFSTKIPSNLNERFHEISKAHFEPLLVNRVD